MTVTAVYRCSCAVLLLPFVSLVYASTEVAKHVVLPESAPKSFERIIQCVLGQESAQLLISGKAIYHARRYV